MANAQKSQTYDIISENVHLMQLVSGLLNGKT